MSIFEKARELGEMLLQTEESKRFENAREAFLADDEAVNLFGEFKEMQTELQDRTSKGLLAGTEYESGIEKVSQKLEDIKTHQQIGGLYEAESEFYGLVNQTLSIIQATVSGETEGGCGGHCASGCGGCNT